MSGKKGWLSWWRIRRATAWGHALVSRRERETQRLVLLEHGSGPNDGAIYELLAGCGLALFTVDGQGPLDRASFARYPDSWDYMARPW
jgi:hypothetical protein